MEKLKNEIRSLLASIQFLTRIPVPSYQFSETIFQNAITYFPFAGLIIGGIQVLFLYSLQEISTKNLDSLFIILVLALGATLTGAFHEDGFADTLDSLGGQTKEKKLEIMKDSRLGTFGVLGLVFLILLKFRLYSSMEISVLYKAILISQILSRMSVFPLILFLEYAGKTQFHKPILEKKQYFRNAIGFLIGSIPIFFFVQNLFWFAICLLGFFAILFLLGVFCKSQIGGITGDSLGFANQVIELYALFLFL